MKIINIEHLFKLLEESGFYDERHSSDHFIIEMDKSYYEGLKKLSIETLSVDKDSLKEPKQENKTITAEELFDTYFKSKTMTGSQIRSVESAMIEFAKLHVEACKKEIADKIKNTYDNNLQEDVYISEEDIMSIYPLSNIR